ncbi:MAG: hypothetical protein LBJ21_07315 [Acidobacteriota bacterium]|jgi:hypothetical protein|nr:hypothetical protein [Acidobacteriota bacterium]
MTNSVFRKTIRTGLTFGGALATAAIFFHIVVLSAQEKVIPEHGSFTDCQSCHQEKYKIKTSG